VLASSLCSEKNRRPGAAVGTADALEVAMRFTNRSIADRTRCGVNTGISRAVAALSALLFVLSGSQAAAQGPAASPPGKWQIGVDGLGAVAVGDFAANIEGAGGVAVYADTALKESVFSLGGELGWMTYGDTSRTVPLGALIPEVPDASVDVASTNQMLLLHGRLRAQRQRGRWRPYADGQLGFTTIYTTTTVEGAFACTVVPDSDFGGSYRCSKKNLADTTNSRDFVLSYGGSVGVMRGLGSSRAAKLDLALRYHRGGEAQYLTEGGIRMIGEGQPPEFSRSRTDMVIFYIGIALGR
jgi:hypothetical protein